MKKKKYAVTWDGGKTQKNLSRTQALFIASDLLKTYTCVIITTYYP